MNDKRDFLQWLIQTVTSLSWKEYFLLVTSTLIVYALYLINDIRNDKFLLNKIISALNENDSWAEVRYGECKMVIESDNFFILVPRDIHKLEDSDEIDIELFDYFALELGSEDISQLKDKTPAELKAIVKSVCKPLKLLPVGEGGGQ